MKNKLLKTWTLLLMIPSIALSQSIVNSVHNLSVTGPGTVKASSESEICVFCHTPHKSSPRKPLWNREDPGLTYTIYGSSTTQASPGQPDGASLLCLSCHDGTIALGNVLSKPAPIEFSGGITMMPSGNKNLSTDLSDDHPVSFLYNSALSAADGELSDPAVLTGPVKLANERVQCTSCHDPHVDLYGQFLVATNQNSDLCLYCHQKNDWVNSSHKNSIATWNGSGNDPWFHTPYANVAENGCENCHNPHNSESHDRLLNSLTEENNCLDCHNGNVAAKNIQTIITTKPYIHDVYNYAGIHDPEENIPVQNRHVECEDCHNPHSSKLSAATAPNANGFIAGTSGLNTNGTAVETIQYQYELCYKCHADSPDKPGSPTIRLIEQSNTRLEYDPANPSYHPIEAVGKNPNVQSMISPYTASSIIYCTNCHASDGTGAPAGPHGSIYPQILKYQYVTADYTTESYENYRLCYECHDRNKIINSSGSFARRVHWRHIVAEDTPCNVCHDPHGISSLQGNATNNTHLINFDVSVVLPSGTRLEFIDQGSSRGSCYLVCHGEDHNPKTY